ncbi:hypothetical protein BpHYR1_039017 [Brachionus plicatilis]|uniref:Uncharacterized protein n=1 Tax=Brachionus plicatilis TaxID=10195 RepID=A0A3M7QLG4_BRAPC|nr:hypothetical protein BpHYR1_039017 [Brachionus plicatilis]
MHVIKNSLFNCRVFAEPILIFSMFLALFSILQREIIIFIFRHIKQINKREHILIKKLKNKL